MTPLTLETLLPRLLTQLEALSLNQITDPTHPDVGAVRGEMTGVAEARPTAELITAAIYLTLLPSLRPGRPAADPALLARAEVATAALLRMRRPSGLIDLHGCNYDSAPDTGFVVQHLCTAIELARPVASTLPVLAPVLEQLGLFVRGAAAGLARGGFHTPNHRWVIASAMAQVRALFPEVTGEVTEAIACYLGEGIDIDGDGAFLERSPAVYDSVNDRSLLTLAELLPWPEAADAAARNLRLNLHLLHADGTIETGLSRRYDYGTRTVPTALVHCLLLCHAQQPDPQFVTAAATLWAAPGAAPVVGNTLWTAYALLRHGDPVADAAPLAEQISRWFPHISLGRIRRGPLSVSLFGGHPRLLAAHYGAATLGALSIRQSYFGPAGDFVVDEVTWGAEGITLDSSGDLHPRRPGYELPLGRPVPMDEWDETFAQRAQYRLPFCSARLTLHEVEGGLDLHLTSLDGTPGVTAQIALDFPPGGIWETDDCCFQPGADQVVFLRRGVGTMRYGTDWIRVSPGADAHRTWHLRDATAHPGLVRVVIPLLTPLDHSFSLRFGRGNG